MDDIAYHKMYLDEKTKRSQRRIDEAEHDPGHLRISLPTWVVEEYGVCSMRLHKLLVRSWRHSCHLEGCTQTRTHRLERRRDRREAREALKRYVDETAALD